MGLAVKRAVDGGKKGPPAQVDFEPGLILLYLWRGIGNLIFVFLDPRGIKKRLPENKETAPGLP